MVVPDPRPRRLRQAHDRGNGHAGDEYPYSNALCLRISFDELVSLDLVVIKYALAFALFCSVIAYFLYFKTLERTGAGNLLICTIIIPLSSILLNAILLVQMITLAEMVGLAIIAIGLLVLDGRIVNIILK